MRFTKLRVKWGTGSSDVLTLSLNQNNLSSPFILKGCTGLEPSDVNLSVAVKADEGGVLQGDFVDNREIVILMGFQPGYGIGQTIGDLRQLLYPMLRPKLGGVLTISLLNDAETEVWSTTGRVKTMTPNIFTKDPEMQIAISCFSPYWDGDTYVHPNPDSLSGQTTFAITNLGTAPSGFTATFTTTVAAGEFVIFNEDNSKWIILTYPFGIGDVINICTISGKKTITMTRGTTTTNMLQYLSPNSKWLQLDGGVNKFNPKTTSYTCQAWSHRARYWGI